MKCVGELRLQIRKNAKMTSRSSARREPLHRKQRDLRRKDERFVKPHHLAPGYTDTVSLLELEVRLLHLDYELAKFYEERNSTKGSESESDSSRDAASLSTSVNNTLPDTEEKKINNKFELEDFNLLVVNPGGLNGKK